MLESEVFTLLELAINHQVNRLRLLQVLDRIAVPKPGLQVQTFQ
jgi:hypothetical protein